MKKVGIEAVYYCKQIMDAIDENQDVRGVNHIPTNQLDINTKEIALEFVETAAENDQNSESTFIVRHLLPFVKKVFLTSPDLVYSLIDGYDKDSAQKPDIKIGFRDKQRIIDAIYFEVKRPNIDSKYQVENDHIKLLKQLKHSIDFQVKNSITSPVASGILCEGYNCSMFQMKVVEYLATNLRQFKLLQDTQSLFDIPKVVECFEYMLNQLTMLQSRYKRRNKKALIIEHTFVKNSFVTEFVD